MKAAGLLFGAIATSALPGKAGAQPAPPGPGGPGGPGGPPTPPTPPDQQTACFLRGTRIKTAKGLCRIETLVEGDLVATRFGGLSRVAKVESFFARAGDGNHPVRVARSALDDNVPSRDMVLTAPHAIYMDGILVSIGNLANGSTIAFEEIEGQFFHIELDTHDVIEAEGAACESRLTEAMTPCAPRFSIDGGRSEFKSRLRSAVAAIVDRRTSFDILRDKVEERSLAL
ncbi:MAG: Hint domain-containing protein [Proteobacteria bacterium]|nr:Hint domain-containing protein [Pseudomonadota bacterium]